MTESSMTDAVTAGEDAARLWWVYLVTGVLWVIYAFVVLSASVATVWAVALLFGVGFVIGGVVELGLAGVSESGKWVHVVFGLIAIVAGVVALAWPGQTFLVLAAITGWFLMFDGIFNVIVSVSARSTSDVWWLGLILGIAEVLVGFWAVGYVGRSVALLIVFVAAAALARGIGSIITGFSLHRADRQLGRLIRPSVS